MPKACLALTCPPVVGSGLPTHRHPSVPLCVTATCWASTYPLRVSQCLLDYKEEVASLRYLVAIRGRGRFGPDSIIADVEHAPARVEPERSVMMACIQGISDGVYA